MAAWFVVIEYRLHKVVRSPDPDGGPTAPAVAAWPSAGDWPWRRWRDGTDARRSCGSYNFRLPWQVAACLGLHPGATPDRGLWRAIRPDFTWLFSKPIYYGGEGGILCQGPKGLENRCKISASRQPRRVACTDSMYRNRRPGSSGFLRMVNAFHHPAHRGSQPRRASIDCPNEEDRIPALRALGATRPGIRSCNPPSSRSQPRRREQAAPVFASTTSPRLSCCWRPTSKTYSQIAAPYPALSGRAERGRKRPCPSTSVRIDPQLRT